MNRVLWVLLLLLPMGLFADELPAEVKLQPSDMLVLANFYEKAPETRKPIEVYLSMYEDLVTSQSFYAMQQAENTKAEAIIALTRPNGFLNEEGQPGSAKLLNDPCLDTHGDIKQDNVFCKEAAKAAYLNAVLRLTPTTSN